jgi:uncharacterized zinc-type alcohol dehydrogenase-like protein
MIELPPRALFRQLSIATSLAGPPGAMEDMLAFAAVHDIAAWVETMPLAQVNKAIQKVMAGKPRFRLVIEME